LLLGVLAEILDQVPVVAVERGVRDARAFSVTVALRPFSAAWARTRSMTAVTWSSACGCLLMFAWGRLVAGKEGGDLDVLFFEPVTHVRCDNSRRSAASSRNRLLLRMSPATSSSSRLTVPGARPIVAMGIG
jgi:hypothetical protein